MGFQEIINGPWGIKFALSISKIIPRKTGLAISRTAGSLISKIGKSRMIKAVRANQWVISGEKLTKDQLAHKTNEVFKTSGQCIFDLYKHIQSPDEIIDLVNIPSDTKKLLDRMNHNEPAIYVLPHLSNFDLAGMALAVHGYKVQILSAPNPGKGYQYQNSLREQAGFEVTPISLQALKKARQRLRSGGSIVTGLDRPVGITNHKPIFFGHPSVVPVAYTRLAIEENVPIIIMACINRPDGSYQIINSGLHTLEKFSDIQDSVIKNTERILSVTEDLIRARPEQWLMFYPVWPDIQVPF